MVEKNTNSQRQWECKERSHHKEGVMTAVVISSVFSPAEVQVNIHCLVLALSVCVCVLQGETFVFFFNIYMCVYIWRPATVEN